MTLPSLRPPAVVNFHYVKILLRRLLHFVFFLCSFLCVFSHCLCSHLLDSEQSGELFLSTDGRERIKTQGHQISDLISSGQTGAAAGRIKAELCLQRSGDLDDLNRN